MTAKTNQSNTLPPLPLSPEAGALKPKTPLAPGEKIKVSSVNEIGGPKGAEPTRFGDWERKGRCSDF
ncbi:MAG TPA: DUF1674 domain-containing protein [Rhodospirillaceae bacterium]|nr:DUF1674 domain-containing protein [Rhodospirillaceae bacterium]